MKVKFTVNNETVAVEVEDSDTLLDVIREKLRLTGTKRGCENGECGACTVLVNGIPVSSCIFPAYRVEGKEVVTIEGLGDESNLHPLQKAFIRKGALQCGFCGAGMLLSAKALLDENHNPTEEEIREGIAGNLCRCTGYVKIIEAIKEAAREMAGTGEVKP